MASWISNLVHHGRINSYSSGNCYHSDACEGYQGRKAVLTRLILLNLKSQTSLPGFYGHDMRLESLLKKFRNKYSLIRIVILLFIFFLFAVLGGYYIFFQSVTPTTSLKQKNINSTMFEGPVKDVVILNSTTSLSDEKVLKLTDRLKIPKIKVDTALESVGLTTEGAMDVPRNPANAAWFNLGPFPGQIGSSVIAGHYGMFDGKPAVFENLHELRKGDKLSVVNKSGEIFTFVVRESRSYESDADAKFVFSSSDAKAHLNLITCEGDWDKTLKNYPKRLVVFTDKK